MKKINFLSTICFGISLILSLLMTFRVLHWTFHPVVVTAVISLIGFIFSFGLSKGKKQKIAMIGNLTVLVYVVGFTLLIINALNNFQ